MKKFLHFVFYLVQRFGQKDIYGINQQNNNQFGHHNQQSNFDEEEKNSGHRLPMFTLSMNFFSKKKQENFRLTNQDNEMKKIFS